MTFRGFLLTALAVGGIVAVAPQEAEARTYVTITTGSQCQDFRRSFIDGSGFERVSYGTACQQPNGTWLVTSENLMPLQPSRVVYKNVPIYAPPSSIIISQPYPYYRDHHRHDYHDRDRWDRHDHDRDRRDWHR